MILHSLEHVAFCVLSGFFTFPDYFLVDKPGHYSERRFQVHINSLKRKEKNRDRVLFALQFPPGRPTTKLSSCSVNQNYLRVRLYIFLPLSPLRYFPRLSLVTCFPAVVEVNTFSPPLSPVTYFPAFTNDFDSCKPIRYVQDTRKHTKR